MIIIPHNHKKSFTVSSQIMDNLFKFSLSRSDCVYEKYISFYLTQIRLVIIRDCHKEINGVNELVLTYRHGKN